MRLETKIKEMTSHLPAEGLFNVVAFEMQNDGEGWSVNTPFRIASGVTPAELPEIVRGRWEVIAANYGRKSVSGLADISYLDTEVSIESDHFPIVDIRPAD
jgi:hypothetical protein